MGLLKTLSSLGHRLAGRSRKHRPCKAAHSRTCRIELLEPRRLLAADIHLGSVYYEDDVGDDSGIGDTIQVTFQGGAPGTQLTHLVIDGDKLGDGGVTLADVFFDTQPGGLGVFHNVPFALVSHAGFDVTNVQVIDGSTKIAFDFTGFDAGEKLVFTIDVDEEGLFKATAIAEGGEFEGSTMTGTFKAAHFEDATASAVYFDEFDQTFSQNAQAAGSQLNLPPDSFIPPDTVDQSDRTAGAVLHLGQIPKPITLAGRVFNDPNLNLVQNSGEPGIVGVSLSLLKWNGSSYVATGQTTVTDGVGDYKFLGLLPGQYRVVETQPAGYFSVGAIPGQVGGVTRGSVSTVDILTDIALLGGDDSVHNNFAEALPAELCGNVYHDQNNNGVFELGEHGIGGVTILVIPVSVIGTSPGTLQTTTAADGSWCVTRLNPGEYRVVELHPQGWIDGLDAPGDAGGAAHNPGDEITGIHLIGGQDGDEYNFGELLPGRIAGRVESDPDGNCEDGEEGAPIAGVLIELRDAQGQLLATTHTDENGEYEFNNLMPGTYLVHEVQPTEYFDGDEHVGTAGGNITANDTVGGIAIASNTDGLDYDFCEIPPASIAGKVWADPQGDCEFGEDDIPLGGVTIELLNANGAVIKTTTTDDNGEYHFDNLAPGVYGVHELQPEDYYQGGQMAGSAGGDDAEPDFITSVSLTGGVDATNYDFCEELPARISGQVHADPEADCIVGPNDILLEGVTIELLDANGSVIDTTLTDENGEYSFENLAPGTYGVHEIQPEGYLQEDAMPGTAGGEMTGEDLITQIELHSGTNGENYDFCELLPNSIRGRVHADPEGDCIVGPNDILLEGVTIELLDANGNVIATTLTDENGEYAFENLPMGTYGVHEVQPDGYLQGDQMVGSVGGIVEDTDLLTQIDLISDTNGVDYDFCEFIPASISGHVMSTPSGSCENGETETPIANVLIELRDANGDLVATTYTDEDGAYSFSDLVPGVAYTVHEVQPEDYFDGDEHVGTAGGSLSDDTVSGIVLVSAQSGEDYDFCEAPPVKLSGYVYQDGPTIVVPAGQAPPSIPSVRNGLHTPDDTPIEGVVLELADASGLPVLDEFGNPILAVTDANGFYEFDHLPPGLYTVIANQPDGYLPGLDVPGSTGGIAINRYNVGSLSTLLSTLALDPSSDALVRIPVPAGFVSINNNFSVVKIVELPPPPPPPENPPEHPFFVLPLSSEAPPLPPPLPVVLDIVIPPEFLPTHLVSWTWHLSVVNAGNPRTVEESFVSYTKAAATSAPMDALAWNGVQMQQSTWVLNDGSLPAPQEQVFGMPGAIPVAGDFNGDGKTDIGVYLDGQWFIDLNGNGVWDAGDLWAKLGTKEDKPIVGDWDGDGKADIGIYGPQWPGDPKQIAHEPGLPDPYNAPSGKQKNMPPLPEHATHGSRALKLTSQGKIRADLIDHVFEYGCPGDIPIAGDWTGSGISRIGVYRNGAWFLDIDGDGKWSEGDVVADFGKRGDLPVVGDWSGDGIAKLGVYRQGKWILDTNNNRHIDALDKVFELGGADDIPVVGDWTGEGKTTIGIYRNRAVEHRSIAGSE